MGDRNKPEDKKRSFMPTTPSKQGGKKPRTDEKSNGTDNLISELIDQVKLLRNEMKEETESLRQDMGKLRESVEKRMMKLESEMKGVNEKMEEMEKKIDSKFQVLEGEVGEAASRVEDIERKLERGDNMRRADLVETKILQDKMEQQSRANNLIIMGVNEKEDEDSTSLEAAVGEITKAMGIAPIKIQNMYRLGRKTPEKDCRPLLVKTPEASQVLQVRKKLKNNADIQKSKNLQDKVFINEDLTEPRRKILDFVRSSNGVEYAYVKEATIICKKDSKFAHIRDSNDLRKIGIKNIKHEMFYKGITE